MAQVQTARGAVDAADLGVTLMHEHLFVLTPDVQLNHPEEWGDEDQRVADAVERLRSLAARGVRTMVDLTVIGLGRYVPRIERIAAQVPEINVVVATGCYTYDEVPFFFSSRGPGLRELVGSDLPDPMVDLFVRDIEEGVSGTAVRAAMLKCAIDRKGMTSGVERIMRAVAAAHHRTGVPITVHTHAEGRTGLDVQRVLCDEEGVDPARVVLAHSGDTDDADHLRVLADAGFTLGMDRFGLNLGKQTFERRAAIVVEMCRRGYASRMVVSQDAACYIDWMEPQLRAFLPQWHHLHLHDEVLPYLLEQGVTSDDIDTMLVANPRRIFGG